MKKAALFRVPPFHSTVVGALALGHVLSRGTLLPLDDIELHRLAFGQRLEAAALDRAVVDEAVLLTVVRGDEAEPLRVVEPLHFACDTHCHTPEDVCSGCGMRLSLTK